MAKFELSLAKDYVPSWDYLDGIRELFQNALDQQSLVEDNEMFFDYDSDTKVLSIGNKSSKLDTSTLLLGATTKLDEEEAIGQFGEGYKVATLVLTRENHPVTFYNYGKKEVWKPRFVKSRRYNADVLTFFIDKTYTWTKPPHNDLFITVENITQEQYDKIVESNLHLQDVGKVFNTSKGRILLDDKYKGQVYVNGLYVCSYDQYTYGYDFKPSELKLDRDRKLISDFDLCWLASKMWMNQEDEEMREIAAQLIEDGKRDVEYCDSYELEDEENYKETSKITHSSFVEKYGERAVPVSSQSEIENIDTGSGYKPVLVSSTYRDSIVASSDYVVPDKIYKPSSIEQLEEWFNEYEDLLTETAIKRMEDIIKVVKRDLNFWY